MVPLLSNMELFSDFGFWKSYLGLLVWNWFTLALAILGVNEVIEWAFHRSFKWLHKHRGKVAIVLLFLAQITVYYAGARTAQANAPVFTVNERDPEARQNLLKAEKRIKTLEGQLTDAQKQAREAHDMAVSAQPKSLKKRILEVVDSIDPTIKERLKTQTVIFRGMLDFRKVEELKKMTAEPGASEYFELRIGEHFEGAMSLDVQLSGTREVELIVERKLIAPP